MKRLRKVRANSKERDQSAETRLSANDLILPYFVVEGEKVKEEIVSMPGLYRFSIDELIKDLKTLDGIKCILLFGISKNKDNVASYAYDKKGVVQKAVKTIKKDFPDLCVMTDICLCGYTTHGHCGIVKNRSKEGNDFIDTQATLDVLSKIAVSHAEAGADFVAPSAMMDGQVEAIRTTLNKNGFNFTKILAYSAKYASNFYGPFRDAVGSAPTFGDRKTYQMDYRNSDEAMDEIEEDIKEGADIVMVKPALAYLDIIYRAKKRFDVPIAAYSVSGEYSMIKAQAKGDRNIEQSFAIEVLTSIKRAGADYIITYFSHDIVKGLRKNDV